MIYDLTVAKKVAEFLLQKKAVLLRPEEPFTWASGWKSPIYCDNRILLSWPEIRQFLKNNFCHIIKDQFSHAETIVGVATAGIAHAALIADQLELPMAYGRTSAKEHGRQNIIEGKIDPNQKVVVVEDLISTGKSSLQVIRSVLEIPANVIGLVAIFSYDFPVASNDMNAISIPFYTLSDYNVLIEEAVKMNYIKSEQVGILKKWREKPEEWGK